MSSHISAGMMTYPVNGATTSGYLASPSDDRPRAGLVVLQEWWGLERHMKELTDRFAEEGFVALTPDLYHGQVTADPAEAQRLSRGLNREQAVREIVAAIRYLKAQPYCTGKVGTVGYCMGGGLSMATACASPEVNAASTYYGGLPNPVDLVQSLAGPLQAVHAGRDYGDPVERARQLREAMARHGKDLEEHTYPNSQHAFLNDTHEAYDPEAAQDAWRRTLDFFRRHLSSNSVVVP